MWQLLQGYDLAHCTASAFSPLVATVLVREYGEVAPAFIYVFFSILAIIGMFISTRTHYDAAVANDDDTTSIASNQNLC